MADKYQKRVILDKIYEIFLDLYTESPGTQHIKVDFSIDHKPELTLTACIYAVTDTEDKFLQEIQYKYGDIIDFITWFRDIFRHPDFRFSFQFLPKMSLTIDPIPKCQPLKFVITSPRFTMDTPKCLLAEDSSFGFKYLLERTPGLFRATAHIWYKHQDPTGTEVRDEPVRIPDVFEEEKHEPEPKIGKLVPESTMMQTIFEQVQEHIENTKKNPVPAMPNDTPVAPISEAMQDMIAQQSESAMKSVTDQLKESLHQNTILKDGEIVPADTPDDQFFDEPVEIFEMKDDPADEHPFTENAVMNKLTR